MRTGSSAKAALTWRKVFDCRSDQHRLADVAQIGGQCRMTGAEGARRTLAMDVEAA